jgi:NADPH:quinone reductase
MRAVQITELSGPDAALKLADLPEPEPSHMLTPGRGVVVDVHSAGVSFPEVLQTRGEYQIKPPLPFVPGSEVGGVVRSAPEGAPVAAGDRVAAFCMLGGFAETAVAPEFLTFPLSGDLDFAQGASLVLNYHTALFALRWRGRVAAGETVLVHGAAGGVGTATLQIARVLAPTRSPSCRATTRHEWPGRPAPTRSCARGGHGRTRSRSSREAASTW